MSILMVTTGEFVFQVQEGPFWDPQYRMVTFTDLKDIPEDFEYTHVIKFVGDIPPPPHTLAEHENIALYEREFAKYLNKS